jgi:hypothetical protein
MSSLDETKDSKESKTPQSLMDLDEKSDEKSTSVSTEDNLVGDPRTHITIVSILDKGEVKAELKNLRMSSILVHALTEDPKTLTTQVNISTEHMKLIYSYMEHHQGIGAPIIPFPAASKNIMDLVKDPWDGKYVSDLWLADPTRLSYYKFICAAHWLDIKCLLHLACCNIATTIKGVPLDKIKSLLTPTVGSSSSTSSSSTSTSST